MREWIRLPYVVFGNMVYGTLNCAFRWTQQLHGLYPLQYFFWMWHRQHAHVNAVHIPSHASKVQHM